MIFVVSFFLGLVVYKKIKVKQEARETKGVLLTITSLSVSFLVFIASIILGISVFTDIDNKDKPGTAMAINVDKNLKKQNNTIKNIKLLDVKIYKKNSPEYVFANFLNSWAIQDFNSMSKYVQTSWREKEEDPILLLKSQYDFKHLESIKITNVEPGAIAYRITANLTYKTPFKKNLESVKITAMVIKENGIWGVNPVSTLREF